MTETHHNSHSPAFGSLPLHDLARLAIPESEDVAMAAQSHKIYGDSHTIEFFTEKAEQGGKLLWATVHVPAPNAEGAYRAVSAGKKLGR